MRQVAASHGVCGAAGLCVGMLAAAAGGIAMAGGLISPDELRHITEEKELEQMREALEKKRKIDDERHRFHDTFMHQEVRPDALERVSALVRGAAERGEREVLALRFPSEYCTDGGRAINNFEPDWPKTLTGFAKRAYEFWRQELEPQGYRLRAQILDFPGGVPGDVGIFLRW
jgi:hypothetical protein